MPRYIREHETEKKRRAIYFLIVCVLLTLNILLLLGLQSQIRGLNKTVKQVMTGMSVSRQEEGFLQDDSQDAPQPESRTEEDVPNQTYAASGGEEPKDDIVDYVSLCGLTQVDKPIDRSPEEVLVCLQELSQDNEQIAEIYRQHSRYSDDMLKALANNPEMADFVKNSLNADARPSYTGLSELERSQDYPLFLQWDPRWGYVEYGDDGSIGLAGCGPTCLSMVCWYLLEDETLTPDFIAQFSMENGYYVWGAGTAWALLEEFPAMYGVEVGQPGINERQMKAALDQGCVLICSMSPGDFTTGGHFIVIYGYDKDGFKVNDSNCVARSRRSWSFEEIGDQIKQVWSYGFGGGAEYRDLYDAAG